jgi:hypothetical protein
MLLFLGKHFELVERRLCVAVVLSRYGPVRYDTLLLYLKGKWIE